MTIRGARVVAWYSELARQIPPRPTPIPAGDKPLASRSLRLALRSLRPRYIGLGEFFTDSSIGVLLRGIRAWIPACAGMTIVGDGNHHFGTNVRSRGSRQ